MSERLSLWLRIPLTDSTEAEASVPAWSYLSCLVPKTGYCALLINALLEFIASEADYHVEVVMQYVTGI